MRDHAGDQLKTVAMFFVILGHFLIFRQGGLEPASAGLSPVTAAGDYIGIVLLGFSIIGTNLFFLITGYYGSKLKIEKILELLLTIYFWGGLIQLILLAAHEITVSTLLHTLLWLPDRYWFIEVYLLLSLATPVLNAFLHQRMMKRKYLLICVWFTVLCVYSTVHDNSRVGAANGFSFVWAAFLYVVGNTLRDLVERKNRKYKIIACVIYLASTAVYIAICILLTVRGEYAQMWQFAIAYNNPLVFAASVSFFFLLISRKGAKKHRMITLLSGSTLGVYLIHTAPNLELFRRISVPTGTVPDYIVFIAFAFICSMAVFLICALLEIARQSTLNRMVRLLLRRFTDQMKARFKV